MAVYLGIGLVIAVGTVDGYYRMDSDVVHQYKLSGRLSQAKKDNKERNA